MKALGLDGDLPSRVAGDPKESAGEFHERIGVIHDETERTKRRIQEAEDKIAILQEFVEQRKLRIEELDRRRDLPGPPGRAIEGRTGERETD